MLQTLEDTLNQPAQTSSLTRGRVSKEQSEANITFQDKDAAPESIYADLSETFGNSFVIALFGINDEMLITMLIEGARDIEYAQGAFNNKGRDARYIEITHTAR